MKPKVKMRSIVRTLCVHPNKRNSSNGPSCASIL